MRLKGLGEWYDFNDTAYDVYQQPGVDLANTALYDLSGDPYGYPNASEISGGQMTLLDFENTTPEIQSVIPSNNIQGEMPAFLNSVNNILNTFGNAYARYSAHQVAPTQTRIVPAGTRPVQPYVPPQPSMADTVSSFVTRNKAVLIPAAAVAAVYFLTK